MSFLQGAIAMCFAIAGLFFLRFWRDTRDRLFLLFALSFWLQAMTRAGAVAESGSRMSAPTGTWFA